MLTNPRGIVHDTTYDKASTERAFLDAVYLYKNYHFDNLTHVDFDKVFQFLPIYRSKIMVKRVNDYYKGVINNK